MAIRTLRGRCALLLLLACPLACEAPNDSSADGDLACRGEVGERESDWVQLEDIVVDLVNDARAEGRSCGTAGDFPAVEALTGASELTCAARAHSFDMVDRAFFDHNSPDGATPANRVEDQGYEWQAVGENIAAGAETPERVVEVWLASDGHCSNIMSGDFTETGVGYYYDADTDEKHWWTQVFANPR